ncbi:ABC transporter permease [Sphingomonas sp. NFR15]|uniref:cell division protein FtsX n=1 Tax=Sphingomonas sp. NFR15 TaxID=1566282 RepID=UPI00088D872F|nr:FtsX-like permease family protein [Sphingomonas sp. NFR15]SDA33728.1 cell division transport system permease protein [Sphingomonas sp. NFR15]
MRIGFITAAADRRLLDERGGTRAMMWIMAIMLFLTALAAALGLATLAATALLDRQLVGRLTVQIVEPSAPARAAQTAAALAALRAAPGVRDAAEVDRARLAALLRPWLGADGADPDLPIPAMIDVDLTSGGDAAAASVAAAVARVAPSARVDRHQRWMSPVSGFMRLVIWLAAGLVALIAGATAAVVILAARASLETHRETIEVMHMLGSTDMQIARLFQRRIALDTLLGGAVGTVLAVAVAAALGARLATLGSDLLDGLALGRRDWALLALLPFAFALLATVAARYAVLGALRKIL